MQRGRAATGRKRGSELLRSHCCAVTIEETGHPATPAISQPTWTYPDDEGEAPALRGDQQWSGRERDSVLRRLGKVPYFIDNQCWSAQSKALQSVLCLIRTGLAVERQRERS